MKIESKFDKMDRPFFLYEVEKGKHVITQGLVNGVTIIGRTTSFLGERTEITITYRIGLHNLTNIDLNESKCFGTKEELVESLSEWAGL